ncbi:MAG: undecaprenyl/decaprenyl-phosphate alpha-N-acetylglucosaminyl 1-phosphate transferase [Desulfohalobiaceae bacterium]|nr:undecaprenyl/decaprenyl-phosphate alpha-N-acetylglucosaminyl 1-phosphate transferase [Desulfohalobiaceae bacterium]
MLDQPDERKIHQGSVPRIGGLAIFVSFFLGLALAATASNPITSQVTLEAEKVAFLTGAILCFATGFWDDVRRLGPWEKFALQILATGIAFWGGLRIHFPLDLQLPTLLAVSLSFCATAFWFLLLVNAVNLIDGLDGLAGGVVLFTCLTMIIFLVLDEDYGYALFFALLGGAVLGFLPYNFSSGLKMFLGDGGSYFLGYIIAGLAVMGSVKTEVGATVMIPLVAMGLPVFEVIVSPLRRFVLAKHPFQPDSAHIHHRLLAQGLSQRKAVIYLYLATLLLCLAAVVMVNLSDEQAGLFLILLGAVIVLVVRGAGGVGYIDLEKARSWLQDVGYATGLARGRRRFLGLQVAVAESRSLEELWDAVCEAARELDMDFTEMRLANHMDGFCCDKGRTACFRWSRDGFDLDASAADANLFKIKLPLEVDRIHAGEIWLLKDLDYSSINHDTLTRLEHLRRSISRSLRAMSRVGE